MTDADETRARAYGEAHGWRVYVYPTDERDPIARAKRDVLMVPGEHFGSPKHLRFGYGAERKYLEAALVEVEKELREIMSD